MNIVCRKYEALFRLAAPLELDGMGMRFFRRMFAGDSNEQTEERGNETGPATTGRTSTGEWSIAAGRSEKAGRSAAGRQSQRERSANPPSVPARRHGLVAELFAEDALVETVARIEQHLHRHGMIHADVDVADRAHLGVIGDGC